MYPITLINPSFSKPSVIDDSQNACRAFLEGQPLIFHRPSGWGRDFLMLFRKGKSEGEVLWYCRDPYGNWFAYGSWYRRFAGDTPQQRALDAGYEALILDGESLESGMALLTSYGIGPSDVAALVKDQEMAA